VRAKLAAAKEAEWWNEGMPRNTTGQARDAWFHERMLGLLADLERVAHDYFPEVTPSDLGKDFVLRGCVLLNSGRCQFRLLARKKSNQRMCDQTDVEHNVQCAMSTLRFACQQLYAVRTASGTKPTVAAFRTVLHSLQQTAASRSTSMPPVVQRTSKPKPRASTGRVPPRSTTASASDLIVVTKEWPEMIMNRGNIALALRSIDELYVVLQQIHAYKYTPDNSPHWERLQHLRGEIRNVLVQGQTAVPQRFEKSKVDSVREVTRREVSALLWAWAQKSKKRADMKQFLDFLQRKDEFQWGAVTPLTQLNDDIRSALQRQNINELYAVLEKMLSLPTQERTGPLFTEIKEYIKLVVEHMPIPPVPTEYHKSPGVGRAYLSEIVDLWIQTHTENETAERFLDFLHNGAVSSW
jgi:hypothetical protein